MTLLLQITHYLLTTVLGGFAALALLRAWCVACNVPMRTQLGELVMTLTNWIVLPLRKLLPASKVDWASLLVAVLTAALYALIMQLLWTLSVGSIRVGLLFPVIALYTLIRWAIWLVIILCIGSAVLSWLNPYHEARGMIERLLEPLLRPIRAVVPLIGRFDLSPLILIVLCNVLLMIVQYVGAPLLFGSLAR